MYKVALEWSIRGAPKSFRRPERPARCIAQGAAQGKTKIASEPCRECKEIVAPLCLSHKLQETNDIHR